MSDIPRALFEVGEDVWILWEDAAPEQATISHREFNSDPSWGDVCWGFMVGNPARKIYYRDYQSVNDRGELQVPVE